jgi:hypothetical protein
MGIVHLKAGIKVGDATLTDEPPALVCHVQSGFPTMLQAGRTALGLPDFRGRPAVRHRTQGGYCTGSLEVHRIMPQDVEAQAGQLGDHSEQRIAQPFSEQVLTLLEAETIRGFDLFSRFQRRGLASARALGLGFVVRRT